MKPSHHSVALALTRHKLQITKEEVCSVSFVVPIVRGITPMTSQVVHNHGIAVTKGLYLCHMIEASNREQSRLVFRMESCNGKRNSVIVSLLRTVTFVVIVAACEV